MQIVIAGKNSIAVDVLEYVLSLKTYSVSVVLNKTEDYKNGFQKSLGYYARFWNVSIISLQDVYNLNNVIFLSLEFDRIIKPKLFQNAQLYNIHFSLLPKYKGMYTSALPLLHDEKFSGVTLHKIDPGIDTGDIIVQKKFEILKDETARELYLKYINYGTKLIIDNLSNLLNMDFTISRQEVNGSSYYGKKCIDYNNLKINYNQTSYQISNQIRAFTFREYQLPKFQDYDINGWEYTFNKSKLIPGSIVNKGKYSLEIATIDYNIILKIDQFMPFINGCKANNYEFVNELITNFKIDLETRTVEGWTPLIIAAYFGAFEVVELLVNAGANINAVNYNGTTVLMYAKNNLLKTNDKRIVDLLFEHGVNTELIDNYGKNVLDWLKVESEEYYQYFKNK